MGNVSQISSSRQNTTDDFRDMTFPAANLLLSNQMAKEHQGVAASLVNTFINYSISLALGIAGTVESHVNDGGDNVLKGYRGAWYLSIGFAASGTIIALFYGLHDWRRSQRDSTRKPKTGPE
jgi:MFS family permease